MKYKLFHARTTHVSLAVLEKRGNEAIVRNKQERLYFKCAICNDD